jgi:aldehyde:ferredoxin oxidoreductase
MYGWTGNILRVNLSEGSVKSEPLGEDLRHKFLGGRGINSKILYDEVGKDVAPLSPENVLIFGTSPLSGTPSPSTPRCTVSAKSPLTGILGDANFGGFFGPHIKFAGFDHLVVTGKAAHPSFLYIRDGKGEIMKADHLAGKTTAETEVILKEQFKDERIHVASIGPAGESMVRIACVVHGFNVAARTGMGAVMGSKNLKAVVIGGRPKKIQVADDKRLRSIVKELSEKMKESPFYKAYSKYGMAGALAAENEVGVLAVRNFQQAGGFDEVENITCETLAKEYYTGSRTCFGCSVACMKDWEVKEGPYAGEKGTKIPQGCNAPNGPACGNAYAPSLFKIYNLCNQYGLDGLDFGCLMSYVMEWYEKGIVTQEETDGLPFDWGNYESAIAMIPKLAKREGFGAVLADGALKAAERIGRGAEKYVSHCKGMVLGGGDPRPAKGMSLTFGTSTRGCDHLRGLNLFELPMGGHTLISPEEAVRRFGTADALDHKSYNKAQSTVYVQDMHTLADTLEICKFMAARNGYGINLQDMVDMYTATTGVEASEETLLTAADRIYTVERCFLIREGIQKKDDFLQGKWARESVKGGPFDGSSIDKEKFEKMLEDYYEVRGWDRQSGIPTKERLERLGMGKVAQDMEKHVAR